MKLSDPFLIDSHKLMYHPERIAQWMNAQNIEEKLAVFPIYVEISPVGQCNHRCQFCAVDYIGYVNRKIDYLVLRDTLQNMAKHGVKSVMFAGEGEPMLHPDIAQLTVDANKAGLDVSFTTNGSALTKKFVDTALSSTKWIKVSINGSKESYAKIHQVKDGTYEKVWSNIEYATSVRREQNLQCAIGVQCVVLPENIDGLEELIQRAHNAKADYVVLKPYSQHKSSLTTKYGFINYTQVTERLTSLAQTYSKEGFNVICRLNAMEDWDAGEHAYHTCNATPNFWAYIMATGDVYSCSAYLLNNDFCMGNINTESFSGVWLGDKRRKHIDDMAKLDISQCRLNCRMNQVNKYLDRIKQGNPHANFI